MLVYFLEPDPLVSTPKSHILFKPARLIAMMNSIGKCK